MAFKGSELRIIIYDKILQQSKRTGDVVRIEVQMRGRILMEMLGNGLPVTKLDFNTCYQAYRRIMMGFVPSPVTHVSSMTQLLAIGERERWQSDGISQFEIYTRKMSERNVRRLQKGMAGCRPDVFNIDWSQLLPADAPPPAVEVEND